jgi:two-component system OmpR family sensor kinase
MSRALLPLLVAALGLAGALAAAFAIYRASLGAMDRELDERLLAAGASAALLVAGSSLEQAPLTPLMQANALEGAYLVDPGLRVIADGGGEAGRKVDLLRVDPRALQAALSGGPPVLGGYRLGELAVRTGYFPVRDANDQVQGALVLEAGASFAAARERVVRTLGWGVALALLGAVALGVVAQRWSASERQKRAAAEHAARGEALARVAAVAAHEIRNPLGVIRGTVELMRERSGEALCVRDREALEDVLGEVERMRRLTEDLLDLSADRPLVRSRVPLAAVVREAARAAERAFPSARVEVQADGSADVEGDPARLRQVFANLLTNAAQAQPDGRISVRVEPQAGGARVEVRDQGPGVPAHLRARLFEPFATGKEGGTGLGLALSRRLVERHGGRLTLLEAGGPGATFEVWLPAASRQET